MFLSAFMWANMLHGQEKTLTGKISDANTGEALPGATLLIKGTEIGTTTDIDGNYSLTFAAGEKLVVSFIGYLSEEIDLGNQSQIDVQMVPDIAKLDEIIVIGYGTQKKSDKTGAVAMVTSEDFNQGMMQDPIQSIQGKVAGVSISKPGSDPNAGFKVKIRGASGFRSNTDPLYVVDGVPGVDPTTIAPEDIESFNVLKDASSTAIYGSRGANGVILIQTKKGDTSKLNSVEFNTYFSIDKVAKKYDMLSADEIRTWADTNNISFTDNGANTDWQDEIFRTGYTQNYNLAASGGSEISNYSLSLTHTDFEGVIKGSDKNRTIGRLSLTQKAINNKLTIGATLSATIEHNDYVSYSGSGSNDVIYQALQRNPTDPVYDSLGNYFEISRDFNYFNPVAIIEQRQDERDAKRYLGNLNMDFDIYAGFSAGLNLGYRRDDSEHFIFEPSTFRNNTTSGYGKREYKNYESKLLETTLRYNNSFGRHNLNAVAGYSFQEDTETGFFAQGNDPYSDYVKSNNLGSLLDVNAGDIGSWKGSFRIISFFGRAVYNYNSKYFFTGTLRQDGSSKFGKNNEWGLFPSASAAWNVHSESFMQQFDFLSQLKLRASWGISGNQEFSNYRSILTYEVYGTAPNFDTGEDAIAFQAARNNNEDLKWEENEEYNIGLDVGFLQNRISGSFEFYNKRTYDLLNEYRVPQPPNASEITWANAGSIRNKGFEAMLSAFIIEKSNISWSTNFIFSTNKIKLESLDGANYSWTDRDKKKGWISGRGVSGGYAWTQFLEEGNEIGTFFMPQYVGMDSIGNLLYQDAKGNISTNPNYADTMRVVVGQGLPDFELGWSNTISLYKHFDIGFSLRGVFGHDIYNVTRMFFANYNNLPNFNATREALDLYEAGTRIAATPAVSSYYIEKASFLRLDYVSLGYNIPVSNLEWMKKARIYFTVNNLFTLTDYSGMDPEVKYDDNDLVVGLDQYNVYPKTRSYVFGLNVTF